MRPDDATLTRALMPARSTRFLLSTSPSPMLQASSRCSGRILAINTPSALLACIHEASAVGLSPLTRRFHASPSAGSSTPTTNNVIQKDHGTRPYWKPHRLPKPAFPKRTILIKGWSPFNNMVEVFAVLRTVEEKYGAIVEYVVSRVR